MHCPLHQQNPENVAHWEEEEEEEEAFTSHVITLSAPASNFLQRPLLF